jgi:hypothetical protein
MRNFYILDAAEEDISLLTFVVPYVELERPMDWIAEQARFWESVAIKYWEFGQLRTHGYPSLWSLGYPKANPAKFFPLERSYVEDVFENLISYAWEFEIRYRPDVSPLHAFSMDVCDLGSGITVAGTSAFVDQLKRKVRTLYRTDVVHDLRDETPESICNKLGINSF